MRLSITLVGGTVRYIDTTTPQRTPGGFVLAEDLEVGNIICLFSDGNMPVEIESIEEV